MLRSHTAAVHSLTSSLLISFDLSESLLAVRTFPCCQTSVIRTGKFLLVVSNDGFLMVECYSSWGWLPCFWILHR
ncbi:hypothetical protein SLE2022_053830 [Rubroshorea leprosula]